MDNINWQFDHKITYSDYERTYYTAGYKGYEIVKVLEERKMCLTATLEYIINTGKENEITFVTLSALTDLVDQLEMVEENAKLKTGLVKISILADSLRKNDYYDLANTMDEIIKKAMGESNG